MPDPICIRCGRRASEAGPLLKGLCPKCYLEVYGPGDLPRKLRIIICPRCGAYKVSGKWIPGTGSLDDAIKSSVEAELLSSLRPGPGVSELLLESMDVFMENRSLGTAIYTLRVVLVNGASETMEARSEVRVEYALCPSCMRKAGKGFEAILQIRGYSGRLEAMEWRDVREFISKLPRRLREAVGEVEELREGVDLKLVDANAARVISSKLRNRFAARIIETHKVVGRRRDGKAKTRITLSVRLPPFRIGDLVKYGGKLARVEDISGNRVRLSIIGGGSITISGDELWEHGMPEKVGEADMDEYMVTAVTPDYIYLMRMGGDYGSMEVPRVSVRTDLEPRPGMRVRLYRLGGKLYLLQT